MKKENKTTEGLKFSAFLLLFLSLFFEILLVMYFSHPQEKNQLHCFFYNHLAFFHIIFLIYIFLEDYDDDNDVW